MASTSSPSPATCLGEVGATLLSVLIYAVLLTMMAIGDRPIVIVAIILSGLASGLLNTLFTGAAMSISNAPRPVASAGYNFCRWLGGAVAATLVGHVAEWFGSPHSPFAVGAVLCLIAATLLWFERRSQANQRKVPAEAALVGEEF